MSAAVTGNGTLLTLGTPHTAGDLVAIGDISASVAVIDDNDLTAGTLDKQIAGDLITYDPFTFTLRYSEAGDGNLDDISDQFKTTPATGTTMTADVVFANGDKVAYTAGFISSTSISGLSNNERILVTYTYQPTAAGIFTEVA